LKWEKKGRIYTAGGSLPWARKHSTGPTPIIVRDGEIRLYVAFTDENTVGRIAYIDVAADDPSRILRISQKPVLDIGQPGAFDENGMLVTSVLESDGELFLYYVGYQLGYKVRYFQFQGLAISRDRGETFERYRRVPVIDRSDAELLNRTSAFVMKEDGRFRMWYVAGSEWLVGAHDKTLPRYDLRYLESTDGKTWGSEGKVVLGFKNDDEHALARPWVFRHEGRYRMFFSRRSRSLTYRIGYAESPDGIAWSRRDEEAGLDVSPEGWDSQMVEYATVAFWKDRVYLFYNGNECGQSGFGYAVLKHW
jgi:predicted GH43/DUF377 family glycosyl hydrolase